jgi:hypothetical protein
MNLDQLGELDVFFIRMTNFVDISNFIVTFHVCGVIGHFSVL